MTPAEVLAAYRILFAQGNTTTVRVRRWSGTGQARTKLEAEVLAKAVSQVPRELVGEVVQNEAVYIVLNDPAAAVPAGCVALASLLPLSAEDFLLADGRECAIKGVDDKKRRIQGTLVALEIETAG